MKRFFFGVFGLLALASCSNDELTSINRDGDEIAFSVVTNSATRAVNVYCNQNKPTSFMVWATYSNATYINGDKIVKDGSKWVNESGTRYWPEDEVTFYAHVNAGEAFQWNDGNQPTIADFEVKQNVAEQKDLLYAVKKASKSDGQASLTFRHALSQIVFQAKNTNPNLYVEISGVSVCKVKSKGTFAYPQNDTDNNIEEHSGKGTISNNGSWGQWGSDNMSDAQTYSVEFNTVELVGNKEATATSLTNTNETGKAWNNVMLLLPQKNNAWPVTGDNVVADPGSDSQTGTYFLVKCQIWNVADASKGKQDSDHCLWYGTDDDENQIATDVAIPVKIDWEQGKKYIYTFVFGDGNGGYNPDPDGPGPDPDPVLVPITFEVTVDDFVNATEEDIEMDEPKATEGEESEGNA